MRFRLTAALVAVLPVVAVATACGGSDSRAADLRKAAQAYSDALLGGDTATAYGLASQHCQRTLPATQLAVVTQLAKAAYGGPQPITSFTVVDSTSSSASVTYTYAAAALNKTGQSWVKESGAWKWNGC